MEPEAGSSGEKQEKRKSLLTEMLELRKKHESVEPVTQKNKKLKASNNSKSQLSSKSLNYGPGFATQCNICKFNLHRGDETTRRRHLLTHKMSSPSVKDSSNIEEDEPLLIEVESTEPDENLKVFHDSNAIKVDESSLIKIERIIQDNNCMLHKLLSQQEEKISEPGSVKHSMTVDKSEEESNYQIDSVKDLIEKSKYLKLIKSDSSCKEVIVRCDLCFLAEHPNSGGQFESFEAAKALASRNSNNKKEFCSGFVVLADLIKGKQAPKSQSDYNFKAKLKNHLTAKSAEGVVHKDLLKKTETLENCKSMENTVLSNLAKIVLLLVKSKSAEVHFPLALAVFQSCGLNIGTRGHSTASYKDWLHCFLGFARKKIKQILSTPNKVTGLLPHFSIALDKATMNRVTNQGVILFLMVEGKKVALPLGSPNIYTSVEKDPEAPELFDSEDELEEDFAGFSSDFLDQEKNSAFELVGSSKQELFHTMKDTLLSFIYSNESILSRLLALHCDGEYLQGNSFKEEFHQICHTNLKESDRIFVQPRWDFPHSINVIGAHLRDSRSAAGVAFKRFIQRLQKINEQFSIGKGPERLKLSCKQLGLPYKAIDGFSNTRFLSSALSSLETMMDMLPALINAYENKIKHYSEEDKFRDEFLYLLSGYDFVYEILLLLDIFFPLKLLMMEGQKISSSCWDKVSLLKRALTHQEKMDAKLKIAKSVLDLPHELFPTISIHKKGLSEVDEENKSFKKTKLRPGWTIYQKDGPPHGSVKWECRNEQEVLQDISEISSFLLKELKSKQEIKRSGRTTICEADDVLNNCFNAENIFHFLSGSRSNDEASPTIDMQGLHAHGIGAFSQFYTFVSNLTEVKHLSSMDSSLMLNPEGASFVYMLFKKTLLKVLWDKKYKKILLCWFDGLQYPDGEGAFLQNVQSYDPVEFSLHWYLKFQFNTGEEFVGRFNSSEMTKSFFTNEMIINEVGKEFIIAFEIAVSFGGCESVVESLYSVYKSQLKKGRLSIASLSARSVVDWFFEFQSSKNFEKAMEEIGQLFLKDKLTSNRTQTTITNCQNSLMSNGKIEIFAEGSSVPIAINLALQLQIYIGSASLKVIHDTKFCRAKNRSENSFSIPTLKILVINQMDKA